MGLVATAQKAIITAFNGPLKEFLKEVTFEYLESEGVYDAEEDTRNAVYNPIIPLKVPCLRPTTEDLNNLGVEVKDTKIIVPGNLLPRALEASDRVVIDGKEAVVRKTVGVPGDVIYIIFVRQT